MVTIARHNIHDFALKSPTDHPNPFQVALSATFEHESGVTFKQIPGFYNDGDTFVIRFSPTLEGRWQGHTTSEDPALDGIELERVTCIPVQDPTTHGGITVDPQNPCRFIRQDGRPFVYMGFECDWLFAYHQSNPERCRKHIELIHDRGFNAVVMNIYAHTGFSTPGSRFEGDMPEEDVYGPPELYVFGGTNDNPDHSKLNTTFFEDYDEMMHLLRARGIAAHLMIQVQNKHVNWPERRSPEDDAYWRYVVARYQAFSNVIWDVGKESYNLRAETGSHTYTLNRIELIRRNDAYGRLVTVHDVEAGSAGRVSEADMACDFVSDQIHLADAAPYNREAIRKQQISDKPYLNIEYGYELGVEDLKTYKSRTSASWQEVLRWTYALYAAGAYPCYYYSNTSWDLIRFEPEPEGWQRYRFLRDLLEALPFNSMVPANELVDGGFCLAQRGEAYLIYLPDGGDAVVDLTAIPAPLSPRGKLLDGEQPVVAQWMAINTGEQRDVEIKSWGWLTHITNPFEEDDQPVVLTIDRRS